jgi:hypothetical protein
MISEKTVAKIPAWQDLFVLTFKPFEVITISLLLQEKIFLNAGFLSHKFCLFQLPNTDPVSIQMI